MNMKLPVVFSREREALKRQTCTPLRIIQKNLMPACYARHKPKERLVDNIRRHGAEPTIIRNLRGPIQPSQHKGPGVRTNPGPRHLPGYCGDLHHMGRSAVDFTETHRKDESQFSVWPLEGPQRQINTKKKRGGAGAPRPLCKPKSSMESMQSWRLLHAGSPFRHVSNKSGENMRKRVRDSAQEKRKRGNCPTLPYPKSEPAGSTWTKT